MRRTAIFWLVLTVATSVFLVEHMRTLMCVAEWNASIRSIVLLTAHVPEVRSLPFGLVSRDRTQLNHTARQAVAAFLDKQWPAYGARELQPLRRAELLWLDGRDQEAVSQFAQLVPALETASVELGSVLFQGGEYDLAAAAWNTVRPETKRVELLPQFRQEADIAFKTKRFQDALNFFRIVLQLDPSDRAAAQGVADSLATLGQWSEAEEAFLSISERPGNSPPDLTYLVSLGDKLVRLDRSTDALRALDLALKLDPDSALAWLGYGNALSKEGRHTQAGEAYQRALQANPDLADGHVSYGIWLLVHKNNRQEAVEQFNSGVALDQSGKLQPTIDSGPWLYQKIIVAYWTVEDLATAREWCERALSQYPDHFLPAYMTGLTLMRGGMVDAAIDWFVQAIGKDDRNPDIREALGEAYERLGMTTEAALQRQAAAELRRASSSP